ncbi:MAG: F0F1 ATP synthase subunit gamma [Rhodospirillaceae bacterium]|jgi:F-type H+-transporting ATPase subunit gamma|nr:F0F1 ATP synthase subunit gamma [Rhodospirillaceae bacterium]
MSNLKDLRVRIISVKSTRKITMAMKMVAVSKLRRAQVAVDQIKQYVVCMERILVRLIRDYSDSSRLIVGTGKNLVHLIIVITSDRGLCGGFNGSVVNSVRELVNNLQSSGKIIKLMFIGNKGRDQLKRDFQKSFVEIFDKIEYQSVNIDNVNRVGEKIIQMFEGGEFDVCTIIYNHFKSALSQEVIQYQLIPFFVTEFSEDFRNDSVAVYEYEPSGEAILDKLLQRNVTIQIFRIILESNAAEQRARMMAMDNATRNADEMIDTLTIRYNCSRQAKITTELTEIISGAEAL